MRTYGSNCGKLITHGDTIVDDTKYKDKYAFANRLWATY